MKILNSFIKWNQCAILLSDLEMLDNIHIFNREPCLPKRLSYTRKCFTKPMQAKPPTHFTMVGIY